TGEPGNADRIVRAIRRNGVEPAGVRLILVTHGHLDHFGSAADLRRLTGAPVAIHRADAGVLRSGRNPPIHPTDRLARVIKALFALRVQPPLPPFKPQVLLEKETDLARYGIRGRVVPTPGHTPGSVSLVLDGGDC